MNVVGAFLSRVSRLAGLPEPAAPATPAAPPSQAVDRGSLPSSITGVHGRVIVQTVDVSPSMNEADMGTPSAPCSRLEAAKSAVMQFTEAARFGSEPIQLGLVAFAERATTVMPLTERDTILKMAQALASLQTHLYTNLEAGLLEAERLLSPFAGHKGLEVHVLTDGEANRGGDPLKAATTLKRMGCTLSFVGIGGNPSKVNEKLLMAAASVTPDGRPFYRFIKDRDQLERHYHEMGNGITL